MSLEEGHPDMVLSLAEDESLAGEVKPTDRKQGGNKEVAAKLLGADSWRSEGGSEAASGGAETSAGP